MEMFKILVLVFARSRPGFWLDLLYTSVSGRWSSGGSNMLLRVANPLSH